MSMALFTKDIMNLLDYIESQQKLRGGYKAFISPSPDSINYDYTFNHKTITEDTFILNVPGIAPEDLEITFQKNTKHNIISVGSKKPDETKKLYLTSKPSLYYLTKEVLVKNVEYKHGQLTFNLYKDVPEEEKPKSIDIVLKE